MNHGSLFSGLGGFDLAAEWMGWDNKFHCDINPFSRKVCSFYWPEAESYDNIKTTDFRIWRGKIDVLSGGFPCQPFSTAGKRMGKEDERHLWPEMFRAIREIRPRYVVGENVRGLLNWSDGLVLEEVFADLESEGYEVQTFVLPAVGINAPHRRDRVYIIAHTNSNAGRGRSSEGGRTECEADSNGESSIHLGSQPNGNEGNASNTECERLEGHTRERKGFSEHRDNERVLFGSETEFDAADTTSIGLHRQEHEQELGSTRWSKFQFRESENKRDAADTKRSGLEHSNQSGDLHSTISEAQAEQRNSPDDFEADDYVHAQQGGPSETWSRFPTQSPLCSGDDGLPSELDGLTFPKWRKESIMGYGNAIVPQVAYRIFATINELENR